MQSPFQIGILLLLYQLLTQIGLYTLPPVTMILVALQTGLFLGYVDLGLGPPSSLCLQARAVLERGELLRVFVAPLLHSSDLHLYYNMVSFAYKGRTIETGRRGSARFAAKLVALTALCGAYYVAIAYLAAGQDP
jgi:rhomboid domain-containing protein 1